jgi:hypothetical protein
VEQLLAYIKSLPDEDVRREFAGRCGGTSIGHLRNIAYGQAKCSAELAALVDLESGGAVRRWHLRPLDWYRIWPELIGADGAPRVPGARAVAAKVLKQPKKTARAVASESVVWPLSQQEADRIVFGAAQPPSAPRDDKPGGKREGR